MKIAVDLTSLDDNFSGIERYSLEITKSLISLNLDDSIYLIFKNKIHKDFLQYEEKTNVFFECIQSNSKLKTMVFLLPKMIKKLQPDFMIFPAFPPSILLKKTRNIKTISVIHDLVCWDFPKTMKISSRYYFRFGIKKALKISYKIIANSEFTKNRIVQKFNYNEKNILIVPCSTNIDAHSMERKQFENLQQKYDLPKSYVLTLSTLEPRKNLNFLLKAYDYACNKNSNIPDMVLVGRKGWGIDKLLDGVSPKTLSKLHFTGFADEEDLPLIYSSSELFIFASLYEGFGIPVLEAIRMGLIVVLSNIPSNRELVYSEYPFIFDFDYDEFYNVLNHALTIKEEAKDEITYKLKMINKKYNWNDSAKVIYDIIHETKMTKRRN